MNIEQINRLSGCVDVKYESAGVPTMKIFNKLLTLATLSNSDVTYTGKQHTPGRFHRLMMKSLVCVS